MTVTNVRVLIELMDSFWHQTQIAWPTRSQSAIALCQAIKTCIYCGQQITARTSYWM